MNYESITITDILDRKQKKVIKIIIMKKMLLLKLLGKEIFDV